MPSYCRIVLLPPEVTLNTHQFAVVSEGAGMIFDDVDELGNLSDIDYRYYHSALVVAVHSARIDDGRAMFEIVYDLVSYRVGLFGNDLYLYRISAVLKHTAGTCADFYHKSCTHAENYTGEYSGYYQLSRAVKFVKADSFKYHEHDR